MSILIKGMEMPKSGEMLCINIYPDGKVCIALDLECKQVATAVPVPPHGRLIDADELEAHGDCLSKLHVDFDAPAGHQVWRECVPFDNVPTIIPAEEATQ